MSIKKWAYDPEKCDGDVCPSNCYICSKAEVDEEHVPIEVLLAALNDAVSGENRE